MEVSDAAPSEVQASRLAQALWLVFIAFALSALHKLFLAQWHFAAVMFAEVVCLGGCLYLQSRGRAALATALMLWSVAMTLSYLIWIHQGPRDPGLVAMAGVLMFAGLIGSGRLVAVLLAYTVGLLALMSWGLWQGWYRPLVSPFEFGMASDLAIIYSVIGLAAWMTSNDLRRALRQMRAENQKARQFNERLDYLAHFDELTGLANRTAMRLRFEQAAAQAQRDGLSVALLYLDLDHFKHINDALGHPMGDALLKAVAQRFQTALRQSDTVGRSGGDEFLVLCTDVNSSDGLAGVARKLLSEIEQAQVVNGLDMSVTASMGIAVFPQDGQDFDSLLKRADIAMYRAKEEGRNTFCFCDDQTNATVLEHVSLVADMRQALSREEFVLHFQPQLRLGDGCVIGAEALIRWQHPVKGLVPPMKFIPVAEKSGQIVEIGHWVLQEACRQAAQWRRLGLGDVMVSVNVSPVQFRRGDIEASVMKALEVSGLPATLLELELTESLFIEDSGGLSDSLKRLRQLGVSFSIDDFGTGYSNLGYLRRFEVERLKIDRSFVSRLAQDSHDEAIVRAIIQMAHGLGLRTIAEGVEDEPTLARLSALGCEQGQGYHWSRPVPADDFVRYAGKAA